MKKKIIGSALALLFAVALSAAYVNKTFSIPDFITETIKSTSDKLVLTDKSLSGGKLQSKINAKFGNNYSQLRTLIIQAGELTPDDCKFIKKSLTGLEELTIEGTANFTNGIIPKGAFDGMPNLKRVKATLAKEIGLKAFSGCEKLEIIDFPNVEKTGVQAFAQLKGSNNSQLRVARFPKLKHADPRMFYYCTNLSELYLNAPPTLKRPEGKEGLWFERVTKMIIHIPSRKVYDEFMKVENCGSVDWSAFNFVADNGDKLPAIQQAAEYNDSVYDPLRDQLLPHFDRTDKDYSGDYYSGDYKLSLNMYTFNTNINAWMNNSTVAPQLSTLDAIKWAAKVGFDAVDVTCYYIPGYSNTAMPTRPDTEIIKYARNIKNLCSELNIAISGTGIQNNFADPNEARRKMDVERIKYWIKIAHEMGAPVLRIFAGPPPADIRREGWEKIARERIAPHIREVAMYAQKNYPDVRIGVQNHGDMLATANQVIQLLKWIDCDNVGIVNDTGFYRDFLNTDATKYDWYRDIALILPYSNNFQIKKKPAGAETQELMDLNRLIRDIRKSPYRGYIPIELLWISKDAGSPTSLKTPPYEETIEFIKKLKQAMEDTKSFKEISKEKPLGVKMAPPERTMVQTNLQSGGGLSFVLKDSHPNILEFNDKTKTLTLLTNTSPYQLNEQINISQGLSMRVTDSNGVPRTDIEEIQNKYLLIISNGKTKETYSINVKRYELINLALNPDPQKIKVSTYRKNCTVEKAFDGNSTGTSGSGYQVDGSQANSEGKETFWLALDLGEEKDIHSIGVAWGTSVANLKKRLIDGVYQIAYTNDLNKWNKLSNAKESGSDGLNGYSAPKGWTIIHSQNVDELPDANGNKVFIHSFPEVIKARYVMVSGKLANRFIEIYNLFVFQKQLADGALPQPSYPTFDAARIKPDYDKMNIMVGRPAVILQGTHVPSYHIIAQKDISVTGTLMAPDGKVIYTSKPIHIKKGDTYKIDIDKVADALGTYHMEFAITSDKTIYDSYYFTSIKEDISSYTYENPYPAIYMQEGRLVYTPDYRGNTVIDYSNVGYKGGGVEIPNVPVRVILEPSADQNTDDTERIQNAINMLGRLQPDKNGFRGAILLKAGTFRVSQSIRIDKSGIIIKGEGDGHENIKPHSKPLSPNNWFDYGQSEKAEKNITKVVATWVADSYNKNVAVFNFAGGNINTEKTIEIADQYVPSGTRTIRLQTVEGLKAGDNIRVNRIINASWAQDLKMDVITDAPSVPSANQWAVNGKLESSYMDVYQERTILSVNSQTNTITLVEPIVDPLSMKYGISTVTRFTSDNRVQNAGIENIQILSRFDKSTTAENSAFGINYKSYDDEYHAQVAVRIGNAENIWVRRITNYHIDVAVNISDGARWVTVQDVNCLEPVSGTGGERRYSFTNSGGSLILNQRNYARYTRHGFIIMGQVMGPNVFYNDRSDYQFDANEPHLRWSTGGLFDNIKGRIYVQNRWNNGTAHGWSGANYTLYNNEGKFIISQNQLAANYLFGQSDANDRLPFIMAEVDPGNVPNFKAYEYSVGKKMNPGSLYLQQLKDRMGQQAVDNTNSSNIPAYKDESGSFNDMFAYLSEISINGVKLETFKKEVLNYTIPIALDYKALPQVTAKGEKGTSIQKDENSRGITFTVTKDGKITSVYTIAYGFVSKEKISSNGSSKQLDKLTDGNYKTLWSQSGSPYVQFYLGDTPVEIEKVSLGYGRNTQIRRQYYFDFEISNDGYTWKKVKNSSWQSDNLGRGHIMGMQVMPGVGSSKSDYETFIFPKNIKARLLRIQMFGARNGQGVGSTNANAYWAIDVDTK